MVNKIIQSLLDRGYMQTAPQDDNKYLYTAAEA